MMDWLVEEITQDDLDEVIEKLQELQAEVGAYSEVDQGELDEITEKLLKFWVIRR